MGGAEYPFTCVAIIGTKWMATNLAKCHTPISSKCYVLLRVFVMRANELSLLK